MQNLYLLPFLLFLSLFVCCQKEAKVSVQEETTAQSTVPTDSIQFPYRIRIGNDTAIVTITRVRSSDQVDFFVSFRHEKGEHFTRPLSKEILIDQNATVLFLDSTSLDYTIGAEIETIEYTFVRGNTLYFKVTLKNLQDRKEIYGRFNMFYQTRRKKEVYGWITDEVRELEVE